MDNGSRSSSPETSRQSAGPQIDPRDHLAAIIASSDDPIISKDLDGTITSWNPAAASLFGYSADEMVGQSILRLVPPELREEEDSILAKIRAGELIDHYETVRMSKSGERIPVSLTISPIRDIKGNVVGASKILRDVSLRKRNDEIRFRLAAIVDSADDAIISKDLNGIIATWNAGAARMYHYTAEEIVGRSILTLIPEELQYEEDEILRKIRAGERIQHYETVRVRKNGERIHVSVTISPIRDEEGRVIGASKIARDISDRKRMERLLIESEKLSASGRMAASIAHEINNPLESVLNLIYLARQDAPVGSKAHEYLVTAEGEIERVSHIARQTLGYYRDTGSSVPVRLSDLLQNVLTVYQAKLITSGIAAEKEFGETPEIRVRKGEILQVFSNIVANSIEAMRSGGKLQLCTRCAARHGHAGVETVIEDNGPGIRPEHQERIFDPFFTTKGEIGTGIGLWVARQLIQKCGGNIEVSSSTERADHGTKVNIFIPFESPAE